jgi:hypothetical protein
MWGLRPFAVVVWLSGLGQHNPWFVVAFLLLVGAGGADVAHSEVCGFCGGNMGRAADPQKAQVCATRSKKFHEPVRGQAGLVDDRQQRSAF